MMRYLLLILLLPGCTTIYQSDISQQLDTATTFTALELMDGFEEGNPVLAPLLETPEIGYPVLIGVKWGVNYGFRQADDPVLCANGIRVTTTLGVMASVSNGLLIAGLATPVGIVAGLVLGGINAFYNDNFIRECRLEERYPDHNIQEAWERGLLYTEDGVPK